MKAHERSDHGPAGSAFDQAVFNAMKGLSNLISWTESTAWYKNRQARKKKWRTQVSRMPLGVRFNPVARSKKYWAFRKRWFRGRVNAWLS